MPSVKSRPASVLVKLDMSVAMAPGATAFTRTPRSPSSDAKCFTSVAIAPFVAEYAASVPTTALAPREEEGRSNVHGEELVKILDRGLLDGCRLRDSGIGHEDVQPIADGGPDLLGELV